MEGVGLAMAAEEAATEVEARAMVAEAVDMVAEGRGMVVVGVALAEGMEVEEVAM
ncbi:hypothetical protein GOP47_0030314, partial [Adiantum capillus-veneris]